MSQDTIHILVTVGIIAVMFAWVPFLNVICPPGWRSDKRPSPENKKQEETRDERASPGSHTSGRLKEQSRDFLHALSTRGEKIAGSRASAARVPPDSYAE